MTVPVQTPYVQYTADGSTGSFAYNFRIFAAANLVVTLDGVVKTLTTDYSVTGVNSQSGGNVVFVSNPGNGVKVGIKRQLAFQRLSDYVTTGDFRGDTVDADFDYLIMLTQQLNALQQSGLVPDLFAATIDAANKRLINLLDPTAAQDAATKHYVDALAAAFVLGTLADLSVTTAKLADLVITTAKLADSAVTTAKLADSAVTTAKLANSSVTRAKVDFAPVIQRVEATPYTTYTSVSATIPSDDSIPQLTEGAELVPPVTITPKSATNRLIVEAYAGVITPNNGGAGVVTMALFQDNVANAIAASSCGDSAGYPCPGRVIHEMVAGGTSAITFKLRIGPASGVCYVNGNGVGRIFGGISALRLSVVEVAS